MINCFHPTKDSMKMVVSILCGSVGDYTVVTQLLAAVVHALRRETNGKGSPLTH